MFLQALTVGFVVSLAKFIDWWGLTNQLARPIFIVPVLGLFLGHPTQGIILGASLELIFLGNVSLGGVMPSDITLGAIFGAAFPMLTGADTATGIAIAVPISLLGTFLYSLMKMVVTALVPTFEGFIQKKNFRAFNRLWIAQFVGYQLAWFLLGFIVILAGTDAVTKFVHWLPSWLQSAMTVAATMLPAVGLALLLKMLWEKTLAPYFFLGFGLGAFFLYQKASSAKVGSDGKVTVVSASTNMMTLITIAFFGFIIAAIVVLGDLRKIRDKQNAERLAVAQSSSAGNGGEDFFDE